MGEEGESCSSVIPDSVIDSVNTNLANLKELETHLLQFLAHTDKNALSQMPPLQRAQSLFLLAKAASTLFALKLRCSGMNPDDHHIKSELERVNLYQDKLERFVDLNKAPTQRSTTLNYRAATRFIEHSLPDLTPEQRKNMRDISKGEGPRIKNLDRSSHKKRKYQSFERQSVQSAAKDFLEKAARELLGDNAGGLKGPMQIDSSDEDGFAMD